MASTSERHKGNDHSFWFALASFLFVALAVGWAFLRALGILHPPDFEHAPNQALHFLGLCFGIAGLTTASVQMVRVLIPMRGKFHRQQLLKRWNEASKQWRENASNEDEESKREAFTLLTAHVPSSREDQAAAALEEFELRGGRGRPSPTSPIWLYDLPIEQLTGQIALTLDAALDDYERYPFLLMCAFGPSASVQLVRALRPYAPPERATQEASPASASPTPLPPVGEEVLEVSRQDQQDPQLLAKAEARSTLMRMAQFEVDSIQIAVGSVWRRRLRGWVVAISTVISLAFTGSALWRVPMSYQLLLSIVLYSVIGGLVAGYLAMILRDIFAMIEGRRRGA